MQIEVWLGIGYRRKIPARALQGIVMAKIFIKKILTRMKALDYCGGINQIALTQVACYLRTHCCDGNLRRLVRSHVWYFIRYVDRFTCHFHDESLLVLTSTLLLSENVNKYKISN